MGSVKHRKPGKQSNIRSRPLKPGRCEHCKTEKTPLWRKHEGMILCNACGLYLRVHNHLRSLDGITIMQPLKLSGGESDELVEDDERDTNSTSESNSDLDQVDSDFEVDDSPEPPAKRSRLGGKHGARSSVTEKKHLLPAPLPAAEQDSESNCQICKLMAAPAHDIPKSADQDTWIQCEECVLWYHKICISSKLVRLNSQEISAMSFKCADHSQAAIESALCNDVICNLAESETFDDSAAPFTTAITSTTSTTITTPNHCLIKADLCDTFSCNVDEYFAIAGDSEASTEVSSCIGTPTRCSFSESSSLASLSSVSGWPDETFQMINDDLQSCFTLVDQIFS